MESDNSALVGNQKGESFTFVLNLIDVRGELPVEVAPGHFFEKADSEQIAMIKKLLTLFRAYGPSALLFPPPYETDIIEVPGKTIASFSYRREPLPEDRWRYWIISFAGSNLELENVASAASLLEHDLELGFTVFGKSFLGTAAEGYGWHAPSLFSFFDSPESYRPATLMNADELGEISKNYHLVKNICPEHKHINQALSKLRDLKSLPRNSELLTIALFSIIESLVTHSPKLTESADSLSHQIRTKMPLLRKRFDRDLNYREHFGAAAEETIWSKLYEYRSRIVHGEEVNWSGSLQLLKESKAVLRFLRETVKLVLLLALREAIFITDLKKC